jgi:predicted nucleotidyltransferase
MKPLADVVDEIRCLLDRELGEQVEAAFIYGSVAGGRANATSDVDTFVVLRSNPTPTRRNELQAMFAAAQRSLAYVPDLDHPVEIFSVESCVHALHEPLTLRALYTAGRGDYLDQMTLDSDCLEILRALIDDHLTITDSLVLHSLTALAERRLVHAAQLTGVDPMDLAERIGVKPTALQTASSP